MMLACIIATFGVASCSDDDSTSAADSQLEQQLVGGIWVCSNLEERSVTSIQFKEGKTVVASIVINGVVYFKQFECTYEVKDNYIILTGPKNTVKLKVRSYTEKEMLIDFSNFPVEGETQTWSFVRREVVQPDTLDNTTWSLMGIVPSLEATQETIDLPGDLNFNGQTYIDTKKFPETVLYALKSSDIHYQYNDDKTFSQISNYDGKVRLWTLPYTQEGYNFTFITTIVDVEVPVNVTVLQTEEGKLIFIFQKEAFMVEIFDFLTMMAEEQGCDISKEEWMTFYNEFDKAFERATLYYFFEPDACGRNYVKESLLEGKWVHEEGNTVEVLTFSENGKLTTTDEGTAEDKTASYDYTVTGNTLTITKGDGTSVSARIHLYGDEMTLVYGETQKVYNRKK